MSTQYIQEPATSGKVILHTTAGDIEVELWAKECPLAARNFVQLCMEGYYNGTIFHRLVKGFILQGGDPTGTGTGGESIYGKPFKDEFHQRLRFTRRGMLGMANAGVDDNGSQFFFTVGNDGLAALNKKHTLFGKITGPTVFNMLKMTEYDVDEKERPRTVHKVIGADILTNPFDDIKPREKEKKIKEKKEKAKVVETKKLNLLSFGDEAEEDEMELTSVNKKLNAKGKSAHDILVDEKLSKQVAVTADEMADYDPEEDEGRDTSSTLEGIRAKFAKRQKLEKHEDDEVREQDLEAMIDEERKRKEKEHLDEMSSELQKMQKEYIKALRPKKEKPAAPEPEKSEAMQMYTNLKMKFKSKGKDILKQKDTGREQQTMDMLKKFQSKLSASNRTAILFDKKVVVKAPEEPVEEKKFGYDLDAEDDAGDDWMNHKFVAEDEDPKVSKAKDANMREVDEDWYDMSDPRNKMNKRRRGEE